ncbi:hypothetical protein H0H87_002577, partial [Tephrocybe sp. NHM501043]
MSSNNTSNSNVNADSGEAVISHMHPSKVPTVSLGTLTAKIIADFTHACKNYFTYKGITEADQVKMIIAAFQDLSITYHIKSNEEALLTMSFKDFVDNICKNFLKDNWVCKACRDHDNFRQQPGTSFHEFLIGITHCNLLLQNMPSFLNEPRMWVLIDNNIDMDLNAWAEEEWLQDKPDFKKWCEALDTLD